MKIIYFNILSLILISITFFACKATDKNKKDPEYIRNTEIKTIPDTLVIGKWIFCEMSFSRVNITKSGTNAMGSNIYSQLKDSIPLFEFRNDNTVFYDNIFIATWKVHEYELNLIDKDSLLDCPIQLSGNYFISVYNRFRMKLEKDYQSDNGDKIRVSFLFKKTQ